MRRTRPPVSAFFASAAVALLFVLLPHLSWASDWPAYRADAARSGYSPNRMADASTLIWTYKAAHPPQPAWPSQDRMPFDRAYQPIVVAGLVIFGTSADDTVTALDLATGRARWTFSTDAPVRFTPVAWRDRLLVASDDGRLYCLRATDGKLLWQLRGGPRNDMLLGNERMISRWPARGGPLLLDDVVYFAAGIWPSEGIFIHAVDPASGKVLWTNDSSGSIEMDQPHPTARARSGVSAQGHFAAIGNSLIVPTGRAVPAVFDRGDGKFRYFHLQKNGQAGGSESLAFDGHFVNGGCMYDSGGGIFQARLGSHVVAHPRRIVFTSPKDPQTLVAVDRANILVQRETTDRKGKKTTATVLGKTVWTTRLEAAGVAQLIAADNRIIAGQRDRVSVVDVDSGKPGWNARIDGTAYGLAVADGRLIVSTDKGMIYCFGPRESEAPAEPDAILGSAGASPSRSRFQRAAKTPDSKTLSTDQAYALAAEEILKTTGLTEGYCLDTACGDGRLALELAKRSKLKIYAVDSDAANVAAARKLLRAAGLYGVRVTVHHLEPANAEAPPWPDWFADLVVRGRSLQDGDAETVLPHRAQRPCGGQACIGKRGAMRHDVRGPLAGAASWTHQYADTANTLCSADTRLKGDLEMLWFRDTDFVMPNRHGRGPAPLVDRGRMFCEGIDAVRAVNVYNGRTLWEVPLKRVLQPYHQEHLVGVAATGSNICLGGDRLYIHTGEKCLALDVATGRTLAEITTPSDTSSDPDKRGKPGIWGYIAYRYGTLFGSLADTGHTLTFAYRKSDMRGLFSESRLLFALDPETGKTRWTFKPRHSIRHNTIAVGRRRVYLIDRPLAKMDDFRLNPGPARGAATAKEKTPQPLGRLVCLDAASGKTIWETDRDIFGTLLALSEKHGTVLMTYQHTRFRLNSELGGRMAAFSAATGKPLWNVKADYISRPIINDRTIYAQPGAWDLRSGERLPFELKRSYGCGILAASKQMLVFRSATLGYFDLDGAKATINYGGIRPGCWINAIPAGGLVLMADAASGCKCSYLNQATVALRPVEAVEGN